MPPSQSFYDRADGLVLEALGLPPAERDVFLGRRCGDDVALRREVESLLAVDPRQLEDLESPLFELFEPSRGEPDLVGPYRVVRRLGEGATATVYEGVRADGSDPRPVALKVLRAGHAEAETLRRFRREGEILADLRHPWIARLRGGGVTDDGRPFLVMDYAEGSTLESWWRESGAGLEERLRLFVDICRVVAYAHGRLVVHGDLKPSNVVVTSEGEPRLLDFGIAKLLDPATLEPTLTAADRRRLTPAYASPEQLLGKPLSTASDVYSLGVVLFEMLTGRRPIEPETDEVDWRRTLLATEAPRPSAVVTGALRRRLEGDLDAVVEKALRKDQGSRYQSVAELADELERHLEGRPVSARGGAFTYRLGKLVRRHRWRLAAAATLVVLFAAFLVDREGQRRRIEEERDKAEQVRDYLLELFLAADPKGRDAGEVTVRDVLDRGYRRLGDLGEQPAVRASFMGVIGEVYGELGEIERAEALLLEALEVEEARGSELSIGVARRRLGAIERDLQRFEDSRRRLRSAIETLEGTERGRFELAITWNELGLTLIALADHAGAGDAYARALEIFEELGQSSHPEATSVRNNQALLAFNEGHYGKAQVLFAAVLERQRSHFDDRHPAVATACNNLAAALWAGGDLEAALPLYESALEIQRRVFGAGHELVLTTHINLAAALEDAGELEGAERLLRETVEELGSSGRDTSRLMGVGLNNLANLRLARGDLDEAESLLRRGIEVGAEIYEPGHPQVGLWRANLGRILRDRGRLEEARRELEAARDVLVAGLGDEHPDVDALRRDLEAFPASP